MPLKKQLCSKIEYLTIYDITINSLGEILPKNGIEWNTINCTSGEFSEESNDSDGGILWLQRLDLVCELQSKQTSIISRLPLIFKLSFSDYSNIVWGTLDNPIISPKIKGYNEQKQISFDRKGINPEF